MIKTTSKGFKWEQVSKDSYKDLETGLTWSEDLPKQLTFYEAQQVSTKLFQILYLDNILDLDPTLNWSVPTIEDFKTAEKHGIRKVLRMNDEFYWSSTPDDDYAWYFGGSDGEVGVYYRDSHSMVRCIGRQK